MVRPCAECAVAANAGVIMNRERFALNTGCFRSPPKNHCRPVDGKIGCSPGPRPGRCHSLAWKSNAITLGRCITTSSSSSPTTSSSCIAHPWVVA
eukprot:3383541-Pyramimonas_sp.AAC.1